MPIVGNLDYKGIPIEPKRGGAGLTGSILRPKSFQIWGHLGSRYLETCLERAHSPGRASTIDMTDILPYSYFLTFRKSGRVMFFSLTLFPG